MKKFCCFLIFLFTINLVSLANTEPPYINSTSAILIDARTGDVLFEKESNKKCYPASTTKILTAYIALTSGKELNSEVIPSRNAVITVPVGSSLAYFSANEKLTLEQVLNGLLIKSGNDAANILAEYISGSSSEFVKLMNKTAKELGAVNSNFVNPHGWHNDEHYTTASDLAKIAKKVMEIETFRHIVSQSSFEMPVTNVSKETRRFVNTNKLLLSGGEYFYPYATGIKTGYTSQAGNCLISSAEKDGIRLISVVLGGHNIPVGKSAAYIDTQALFEYGFENYHNQQLVSKNQIVTSVIPSNGKRINLFKKDTLKLVADKSIHSLVPNGETPTFEKIVTVNEKIKAPIKKGDVLGTVTYKKDDNIIEIINLLAEKDIRKENFLWKLLRMLILFVLSVILIGVMLRIFNEIRKRVKRYKRRKGIR